MTNRLRVILLLILVFSFLFVSKPALAQSGSPNDPIPFYPLTAPIQLQSGEPYLPRYGGFHEGHDTESFHTGSDLPCTEGDKILSPMVGQVIYMQNSTSIFVPPNPFDPNGPRAEWNGPIIFIQVGWFDKNLTTPVIYGFAHLSDSYVVEGDIVRQGQVIASCGFSNNYHGFQRIINWHLHFWLTNLEPIYIDQQGLYYQFAKMDDSLNPVLDANGLPISYGWVNPNWYPNVIYPLEDVPLEYYLETVPTSVISTSTPNKGALVSNIYIDNPDKNSNNSICTGALLPIIGIMLFIVLRFWHRIF